MADPVAEAEKALTDPHDACYVVLGYAECPFYQNAIRDIDLHHRPGYAKSIDFGKSKFRARMGRFMASLVCQHFTPEQRRRRTSPTVFCVKGNEVLFVGSYEATRKRLQDSVDLRL